MSRTIISTDSPADVPPALCERYGIRVIGLHVALGDKSFTDGVDIGPDDLYAYYRATGALPKTSAVSIAEYRDFFCALTADGADVVHVAFSSRLSATYQNVCLAAGEVGRVHVVDSKSLTTGIALLCIYAAELAEAGKDANTIVHELEYRREKAVTTFLLDKLEFLRKGGRCSALTALGANVLGIKPQIVMRDGALTVGKKYRGRLETCQLQYVRDLLAEYEGRIDLSRCFLSHTAGVSDEQLRALQREVQRHAKFREVFVSTVGCTITAHCGERTFTLEFLCK